MLLQRLIYLLYSLILFDLTSSSLDSNVNYDPPFLHSIQAHGWPHPPFSTCGRDIVNARGEIVIWAGVNWPMSLETMVAEGLEWQSADEILSRIASVGFNFIRMGYAVEMVDQVYERNGSDVPLEVAMITALGYENGTKVTNQIVQHNPSWSPTTTRFQIWDDITKIALSNGIFIHPDVHVSKAQWCCSHTDGNAWFDDLNFDVTKWKRGLQYVANWAKAHPNVVSMSLRNELRESWTVNDLYYNWQTLVGNMTAGADAIHEADPDLLITWSGMQYDQDLSALTSGHNILTAPCYKCTAIRDAARRTPEYFDLGSHPWSDKLIWELHLYGTAEDIDTGTCEVIQNTLYRNGFNALGIDAPAGCHDCDPAKRLTPVILSEFGLQHDPSQLYNDTLHNCLKNFTIANQVSWSMWSLAGSFRLRSGIQGYGDTWGMMNYDWSDWNYPQGVEDYWKPWVKAMGLIPKRTASVTFIPSLGLAQDGLG